jgi:TolA-binding protein
MRRIALAALLAASAWTAPLAHAALFEDDEARRAILDLRQKVEQQRQTLGEDLRRATEENAALRRGMLDLQNQIEALRGELARLRGQDESLLREISELQRRQKDVAQGVEERLRKFEPVQVTVDGREFAVEPAEQREFEGALASFRKGEFVAAQSAFMEFMKKYPQSGYRATALFWCNRPRTTRARPRPCCRSPTARSS